MQEEEFNWLLKEEVHSVLKQLQDILKVNIYLCKHTRFVSLHITEHTCKGALEAHLGVFTNHTQNNMLCVNWYWWDNWQRHLLTIAKQFLIKGLSPQWTQAHQYNSIYTQAIALPITKTMTVVGGKVDDRFKNSLTLEADNQETCDSDFLWNVSIVAYEHCCKPISP